MTCPICQGKGFTTSQKGMYEIVIACSCQRKAKIQQQLDNSSIPRKYQRYTLSKKSEDGRTPFKEAEGFYVRGLSDEDADALRQCKMSQKKALSLCRARFTSYMTMLDQPPASELPGLMLSGTCGIGKTHLAATLLTDLVWSGLTPVMFIEYTQLLRRLRYSYGSKDITEEDILEPLVKAKVLVLDDLGAQASDNQTWVQDILGYLLNERYGAMLPTIITTNFPDEDSEDAKGARASGPYLTDRIGTRLRSRIREMCPLITMHGLDLRQLIETAKPQSGPKS